MNGESLLNTLIGMIRARQTSSFFLNGAPGSGKTYQLRRIEEQLPTLIAQTTVLGPYDVLDGRIDALVRRLLDDLTQAGYLDDVPPMALLENDLVAAWRWLGEHLQTRPAQTLLVLLDAGDAFPGVQLTGLFSGLRALDHLSSGWRFRLHHVVTGYWDNAVLEAHYKQAHVSFPYTLGHNYYVWYGLEADEVIARLPEQKHHELRGHLLHELTGGHPAVIEAVLERTNPTRLTLHAAIRATRAAAKDSPISERLVGCWQQFTPQTMQLIRRLLSQRRVRVYPSDPFFEVITTSGLAATLTVNGTRYVKLRSYFVELALREHAESLGLALGRSAPLDELASEIVTYNQEAYRLIHEIESLSRNFAVAHIVAASEDGSFNLDGLVRRKDKNDDEWRDIGQRARFYQTNSPARAEINGLIAYITTSDLAQLIKEVFRSQETATWRDIADGIERLVNIRNAVMHNQLIDDDVLEQLYALRAQIYRALDDGGPG